MDIQGYRKRIIDKKITEYLKTFGAVCIEGLKWCGKTWTSRYHSKSEFMLGDPAGNFQNRKLAELVPNEILNGETPRLIDEWQEVPPIWDAVRFKVDQSPEKGQFILTGSSTPNHKGILHSGAGRIAKIRMRPMSLYESGDSDGKISLEKICKGEFQTAVTGEVKLSKIISLIIGGGWPDVLNVPYTGTPVIAEEYLRAIIDDDVYRLDGTKRNTAKIKLLLKSLARNESTTVSNKKLKNDIKAIDDDDIDIGTIGEYLDIFRRLFITEDIPPFSSKIRSSVRIKQSSKRHFSDPSLVCALLKATPQMLINDLETLGFLFESLCERDLMIYAESFGGKLYHYQDYDNREIDSVISLPDGNWAAFEIKLGANQIDIAAKNLLRIQKEISTDENGIPPSVLCVVCGLSNAAYRREDGVYVVPITSLKN